MNIFKVTRTRFFLLWCAGVVIFIVVGWKMIFKKDEAVRNRLHVYDHSRQKVPSSAPVPVLNGNTDLQHIHQLNDHLRPPSSIQDILHGNTATQDQNSKASASAASDSDTSFLHVPLIEGKTKNELFPYPANDIRSGAKMLVNLDRKDDLKFVDEVDSKPFWNPKASPNFVQELEDETKESSSQSSDGSSEDGRTKEAAVNAGALEKADTQPVHPNVPPQDGEINESGQLAHLPPIVPQEGKNIEVSLDTAKSAGTVVHNAEHIHHPTSKILLVEETNNVATRTGDALKTGFVKDGDTHAPPGSHHEREGDKFPTDSQRMKDLAANRDWPPNYINRYSNPPKVEMQHPIGDENVDRRLPGGNVISKVSVPISGGKLTPGEALKPASDEQKQAQQPTPSRGVEDRSNAGSRKPIPPESETEQEFLQRMEEVQRERHDRIRQVCQNKYNLNLLDFQRDYQKILGWKKYFEHAYANDDHRFIICRVLKVGSFSWRKVMISLYKKGSPMFRRAQDKGDYPMMDYSDETFMSKLQSYKKVLFVRDPFARFLSAYRDKYVELRHFPYYMPIGMSIIRKYRKNPTQAEISTGRPTFEEFTRWVIAEEKPLGDFHWRPLFNVYHPCEISYDYIGKLETAAEDAKYIFKMIGIDKLETYPSTETHHKFSSSADVLQEFYSQLSPELLPLLIERYKEEFELFDYPVPQKMSDIWTRT